MFDEFYYYPKCIPFDMRLIKLYFFQIFKERKNSDLEKIKPKRCAIWRRLRLNFNGGG